VPLGYYPKIGEVLTCDFSGFVAPEMVKARWVVVVSPKFIERPRLVTVVPLSTTAPNPVENYHVKLSSVLPHNEGDDVVVWAKCDMVFSASFNRLNPWWRDKSKLGKRVYIPVLLTAEEMMEIRHGVIHSLGLGHLTKLDPGG
jgi:mRNA interferase MazF